MIFKNYNFIFCSFYPVGLEDYEQYFINNFISYRLLKFKFPHSQDKKSYSFLRFIDRNKNVEKKLISFSIPGNRFLYFLFLPLSYFIYFIQTIFFVKRENNGKKSIFMGVNHICAFFGIILKKIGKVDFVIYRVMDFFPIINKGPYRLVNRFFHLIDSYCLKNSDYLWFTTLKHIEGREKYGYFERDSKPYLLVPLGIDLEKIHLSPEKEIEKHSLIYCGVISRYQMLELGFESIKKLIKKYPDIKLKIIGSGPDFDYYKNLAKEMGVEKNIIFYGFVKSGDEFHKLMSESCLGLAFYKDEEDYMRYTEPAKVKYYFSFGIPAIVSDVPATVNELKEKKLAFIVKNDSTQIAKKIDEYFSNVNIQKIFKNNVKKYLKEIDVNKILNESFTKTKFKN